MLEKVTHIEGLEGFDSKEMYDDTPPDSVLVRFDVRPVEQPFLSAQENRIIYKNIVFISKEWELGRSSLARPIRDTVAFDEKEQKWKISKLAPNSDIKKYPAEWNAFQRGQSNNDIGTPLLLLFKTDPSRVEWYKFRHITTVERLAAMNHSNSQDLGMGVSEDIQRAQNYLAQTKSSGAANELKARLEEKDSQVASLQNQLADLSAKLTEVLKDQTSPHREIEPAKKGRGRPRKVEVENLEELGIEG